MKTTSIGSAHANAWLHGLGYDLPEEVIILPEDGPKSNAPDRNTHAVQWPDDRILEVHPNPARTSALVVYDLPGCDASGELRVIDMNGRILKSRSIGTTAGTLPIDLSGIVRGMYLLDLRCNGGASAQCKLMVE